MPVMIRSSYLVFRVCEDIWGDNLKTVFRKVNFHFRFSMMREPELLEEEEGWSQFFDDIIKIESVAQETLNVECEERQG